MKIKTLLSMNKKYSSITVYELDDKTFKAEAFIYSNEKKKRRSFKFISLDDYKEYLFNFKIDRINNDRLYACFKLNDKDDFYVNIYLLLKYHLC